MDEILKLAARFDEDANSLLRRAEGIWSWRKRDRKISIAIADISRTLREASRVLRTQAQSGIDNG
jgi:hypothetical protein